MQNLPRKVFNQNITYLFSGRMLLITYKCSCCIENCIFFRCIFKCRQNLCRCTFL